MTPALAIFLCVNAAALDGDTWRCADGTRVRAWGITAPEKHQPGGHEATRAAANLITGKTLVCEVKGPPSYGRKVALCRLDGRDVAAELVGGGFARDWERFSGGAYRRFEP